MPTSSSQSARVFVPRRRYSALAIGIWLLQHGIAVLAVVLAALPLYVKILGGALLLAAAGLAWPRPCEPLQTDAKGRFRLPARSLTDLHAGPGTRFTQWWILLDLRDAAGGRRAIRIWRDSLRFEDWRALLVCLREHHKLDVQHTRR